MYSLSALGAIGLRGHNATTKQRYSNMPFVE